MAIVKCKRCEKKWEIINTPDYGRFICRGCLGVPRLNAPRVFQRSHLGTITVKRGLSGNLKGDG